MKNASEKSSWLETQLRKLTLLDSEIKDVLNVETDVVNEFMDLTPLKLIFYRYVTDIYTKIIPKYKEHVYYVDLFAGSGINKIEKGISMIGSPLIASLPQFNKFENLFFLEVKKEFCQALSSRLDNLEVKNCSIICDDCNKGIDNIIDRIKRSDSHSLIIIDPYAMEIKWETMKKLLETRSDIILTFQSRQIARAVGKARSTGKDFEVLNNFFGDNSWKNKDEMELKELYINKIVSNRKNSIIETVNIKGNKFGYYLFFITTKTKGDNPWMSGIRQGKNEIEKGSSELVRLVMDVISDKQKKLF